MLRRNEILTTAILLLLITDVAAAGERPGPPKQTVDSVYPGITAGVLTHAILADLPKDVLLRSGSVVARAADLERQIAGAREALREQLRQNALFVLERFVQRPLLLQAARKHAKQNGVDLTGKGEAEILQTYFDRLTARVKVTDTEIVEFYEKNKAMCGGVPLARMKSTLRKFVLNEKRQKAVVEHVRTLGKRMPIAVAAAWLAKQAPLIRDNPVDKARASGKPSLIDFGSEACRPCQMMEPILEKLTEKHQGKANILFVHVGKEQILAARYGIRSIPVQVFFDKNGKEVFRHVGFFPQDEIEKKLTEMGVK